MSRSDSEDGPIRLLVVETDPDLLTMVEVILAEAGYVVVSAVDEEEALALAQQQPPALVLVDLTMSVEAGQRFTRRLRARCGRVLPLVVMIAGEENRDRARNLEADAYLKKPFGIDELVDVVHRLAGKPPQTS